ncbi:MAG: response regulator [Thermoguttaceae bacterium]|jgi:DNA-binding response OmpR family regulator
MSSINEPTIVALERPARSTQSPVVLCIDDDPQVSDVIRDRLDIYDVKVLSAYDGMQGLWLAVTKKPDVIITDLRMPMGDGAAIIECLKRNAKTASIPIIVLTAKCESGLQRHMEKIGADRFLTKPIHFKDLLEELRRYIKVQPKEEEG